jgi:hypothetical protein
VSDDPKRTPTRTGEELAHAVEHVRLANERPLTVDELRVMVRHHERRIHAIETARQLDQSERELSHVALLESVKAHVKLAIDPLAVAISDVAGFVLEARNEKRALVVLEERRAAEDARVDKLVGRRKEARSYGLMTYVVFTAPVVALIVALVGVLSARCGK